MSESQSIIAAASTPAVITDAKGRRLEVLRVQGSKLSRLILVAGDGANNPLWLSATLARASIRSIDGMPVPTPTMLEQMHSLWDIVDADAATAAGEYFETLAASESVATSKNLPAPQASESAAS